MNFIDSIKVLGVIVLIFYYFFGLGDTRYDVSMLLMLSPILLAVLFSLIYVIVAVTNAQNIKGDTVTEANKGYKEKATGLIKLAFLTAVVFGVFLLFMIYIW